MNNYNCIIDFYKSIDLYNEEYFNLIKEKTVVLKGNYDKIKDFIGFYPKFENGELKDFKLCLPELVGLDNILIYIHEYCHALFPDDTREIFPNIIEAQFIKEYLNIPEKTRQIIRKTKKQIAQTDSFEHKIGGIVKIKCLKGLK